VGGDPHLKHPLRVCPHTRESRIAYTYTRTRTRGDFTNKVGEILAHGATKVKHQKEIAPISKIVGKRFDFCPDLWHTS